MSTVFFVHAQALDLTDTPLPGEGYCHSIQPGGTGVGRGYGSPISQLSGRPLIKVWCAGADIPATFGDAASSTYIYRYGYAEEQGAWKKVELTGYPMVGDWFVGTAYARLPQAYGDGRVLAYICERSKSAWKCGCADKACTQSMWQLQVYGPGHRAKNDPDKQEIMVTVVSSQKAEAGKAIGLAGFHFGLFDNDIYFDDKRAVRGVPSPDRRTLEFVVPDLPPKKYAITVRNGSRTSKDTVYFWLLAPHAQPPRIVSLSPTSFSPGDTLTITGSGFTKENNEVVTSFGTLTGIPSDGTKISFVYEGLGRDVHFHKPDGTPEPFTAKTGFSVANVYGVSNQLMGTLLQ